MPTKSRRTRKPTAATKSTSQEPVLSSTLGTHAVPNLWHPHDMRRSNPRDFLYRYGRWVYRCIDLVSDAAANIKPRLFVVGDKSTVQKCGQFRPRPLDTATKAYLRGRMSVQPGSRALKRVTGNIDDLTEVLEHPALDLLDNVNEWEEGYGFRKSQYSDLMMFGRVFSNIVTEGKSSPPVALWRMHPHLTDVQPHPVDFVSHFEYGRGTVKQRFEREDVFWLKRFDPDDPWGGFGPLEAWIPSIDADNIMVAFQQWIFRRGGTPDVLISVKGALTDEQRRRMKDDWRRQFGNMAYREESLAILEGEGTAVQLANKPREMEFRESREMIRDEICQAFGVPKALVTSDDVNLANAREGSITFMRTTVWPMVRMVEDAINQRLLPLWSDRLVLIHDNPIQEDRELRIQERASKLGAGYSVNELRLEDGDEPLDDPMADKPLIASGFVPLENIAEAGKPVEPLANEPDAPTGNTDDAREPSKDDKSVSPPANPDPVGVLSKAVSDLTALVAKMAAGYESLAAGNRRNAGSPDHAGRGGLGDAGGEDGRGSPDPDGAAKSADGEDSAGLGGPGSAGCACGADHSGHGDCRDGVKSVLDSLDTKATPPAGMSDEEAKFIAAFAAAVERELRVQVNLVVERMSAASVPDVAAQEAMNAIRDPQLQARLVEAVRPYVRRAIQKGGQAGIAELAKLELPTLQIGFDVANPEVQAFVDRASTKLADSVNGYTEVRLRDLLGDGLAKGESVGELTKRVQEWAGSVGDAERATLSRATNIARTESARAYMSGTEEAWKQSGVVTGKQWLLSPSPCPFCEIAAAEFNAKTVALGQPFYAKGSVLTAKDGTRMKLDYEDIYGPPLHPQCVCAMTSVIREDLL